ncbi:MAG: Uma2 family endonuclease [Oscillatoriales cyanobacterium]|nr:MAG: Uma2 family endonuclease [Oscillatoriales cyanobacterium]
MLTSDPLYIHPEDYLAGELASPVKHEYRDGEVLAMSGGTQNHATIILNLATALKLHLRGSGCRPFAENMKVQVRVADAYYYPDIAVTCDERDRQPEQHFIEHPRLIIEVLSPSTAKFDRDVKFADYRTLESLVEYVLVASDRREVEVFRRQESGRWTQQGYRSGEDEGVRLESVDFAIGLREVYEDTPLSRE